MDKIDFDNLLNYCLKLNESTNEKCLVCHIPVDNQIIYLKLNCNHYYHKKCINYKYGKVKCLYCEKVSLPKLSDQIEIQTISIFQCNFILKTGPNKGNVCDRVNCKYHKKIKENNLENNICQIILKNGINKGKVCGRVNCSYHGKTNKINQKEHHINV